MHDAERLRKRVASGLLDCEEVLREGAKDCAVALDVRLSPHLEQRRVHLVKTHRRGLRKRCVGSGRDDTVKERRERHVGRLGSVVGEPRLQLEVPGEHGRKGRVSLRGHLRCGILRSVVVVPHRRVVHGHLLRAVAL